MGFSVLYPSAQHWNLYHTGAIRSITTPANGMRLKKKCLKIALWTVSKTEGIWRSCGQPIRILFSSSHSFLSCLPPSLPVDFAGDSAPFLEDIYLCLLLNSAAAAQTFSYHCVVMQSWFCQKSGVCLPWTWKSSTLIRKEGWLAGRQHDWLSLVSLGTQTEKVRK